MGGGAVGRHWGQSDPARSAVLGDCVLMYTIQEGYCMCMIGKVDQCLQEGVGFGAQPAEAIITRVSTEDSFFDSSWLRYAY